MVGPAEMLALVRGAHLPPERRRFVFNRCATHRARPRDGRPRTNTTADAGHHQRVGLPAAAQSGRLVFGSTMTRPPAREIAALAEDRSSPHWERTARQARRPIPAAARPIPSAGRGRRCERRDGGWHRLHPHDSPSTWMPELRGIKSPPRFGRELSPLPTCCRDLLREFQTTEESPSRTTTRLPRASCRHRIGRSIRT